GLAQHVGSEHDIKACPAGGRSGFLRHGGNDRRALGGKGIGGGQQNLATRAGAGAAPGGESGGRCFDGTEAILDAGGCSAGDDLAGHGVLPLELCASAGCTLMIVDEKAQIGHAMSPYIVTLSRWIFCPSA